MAIELPQALIDAKDEVVKNPALVVEFEGISTIYSSTPVGKYWRIGDPEVVFPLGGIGMPYLTIGGIVAIHDQSSILSLEGSSSRLSQQLDAQNGKVSIPTMELAFIDQDEEATQLISPSIVVTDMLARKTTVRLGLANIGYPEDYIVMHRGIIDDIEAGAGLVKLNVAHPETLKRQTIFVKSATTLSGAITSGDTTINVANNSNFIERVLGPNGSYDATFSSYFKIDDEIIKYTTKGSNTFTSCVRAQLGTVANSHDINAPVESFYVLEGNAIELALKLMISKKGGSFASGVNVASFVYGDPSTSYSDGIFFDFNVQEKYGVNIGDYFTTASSGIGGNNVTDTVQEIGLTENGSYIRAVSSTFTTETNSPATVSFRSQWDTLPDGMAIDPQFVDVEKHVALRNSFVSSFDYRFYLKDDIDAVDFLPTEIYKPAGLYTIPRNGLLSCNYTSPPLPTLNVEILDETNIKSPSKLVLKRSINKNFYNSVIIKFNQDSISDDFLGAVLQIDAGSRTQIPVGAKIFSMESLGLRSDLAGITQAQKTSTRSLLRYSKAAEYVKSIKLFFNKFGIECGDIVILDSTNLKIANTADGTREKPVTLYEVTNRVVDFKNGEIELELTDTGYNTSNRYAVISPSSHVKTAINSTSFVIESSYNSNFAEDEFKKWDRFIGANCIVRSPDYTTRVGTGFLQSIAGNTLTFTALGVTPQAGDILELGLYSNQPDLLKLLFAYQSNGSLDFADGKFYAMI
jgi:hypothetical protein